MSAVHGVCEVCVRCVQCEVNKALEIHAHVKICSCHGCVSVVTSSHTTHSKIDNLIISDVPLLYALAL